MDAKHNLVCEHNSEVGASCPRCQGFNKSTMIVYQPPYSDQFQLRDAAGEIVYAAIPHKGNKEEARRFATLLSTAPDLLAALEKTQAELINFVNGDMADPGEALDLAWKAIKKALGK